VELTLAIETSSASYGVALFDDTGATRGATTVRRTDPAFVNIAELVAACLRDAGLDFDAVGRVCVDLGPGNLGSVRAGVAYANGLGFSLGIPVVGVDSLRLLALTAAPDATVLCVRTSASGHVYAALFTPDGSATYRHGPHQETVLSLADGHDDLVLAGTLIKQTQQFLGDRPGRDSGIEAPDVAVQQRAIAAGHHIAANPASPITEASALFGNQEERLS
jgi:tRNA threonylcarbamoyladenosine biosynthesis protein TsaB